MYICIDASSCCTQCVILELNSIMRLLSLLLPLLPLISPTALPVIDQSLYLGSTQLHTHAAVITKFIKHMYDTSDLGLNTTVIGWADPDISLLNDELMLGDACQDRSNNNITRCVPLHELLTADLPTRSNITDLSYITHLTSLNAAGITLAKETTTNVVTMCVCVYVCVCAHVAALIASARAVLFLRLLRVRAWAWAWAGTGTGTVCTCGCDGSQPIMLRLRLSVCG